MKLAMFDAGHGPTVGILHSDGSLLDLAEAARLSNFTGVSFASIMALIEQGEPALDAARSLEAHCPDEAVIEADKARLLCPIHPPRLRDTLMFLEHLEQGLDRWARNLAADEADPEAAFLSLKATGRYDLHPVFRRKVIYYNANHLAVSGPDEVIEWPQNSTNADFELEFACVMGRSIRNADETEAASAIFGYTIFNDWSARDLQLDFMLANLGPAGGKDFAGGNTLGPCIVTADEIPDPYNLAMTVRVNGATISNGSTASMHHKFEHGIAEFSQLDAIVPGEVIASGTVLNGSGYEQGMQLGDGDTVELEIEGIGVLRNSIRMQKHG